jgi:molybdenum cofactor cytidylyltransferase
MPSERVGPVAGILLAAGLSSRMGSNKLLFEVEGESLLRRSARKALAGGLDPLLVVLGHEAERTGRELAGLSCRMVLHPGYEQGITTSVQAGVSALPAEVQGAMVLLADMPHVTPEMISALIARYRSTAAPLVISDYEGVNAPPMLYDRVLFDEIQAMTAAGCGKQVVKRHRGEAEVLFWPAAALADLDVPEDYERLLAGGIHAH